MAEHLETTVPEKETKKPGAEAQKEETKRLRATVSKKQLLKTELKSRREHLAKQQQSIRGKLSVLVLVEGWSAAGKGSLIGKAIDEMDPRFFKVSPAHAPTEDDRRHPFIWRHFNNIPETGKFLFLDSGWMEEIVQARVEGRLSDKQYDERLESVNVFERQLAAGGCLIIKLFVDIKRDEQKQRIRRLLDNKDTAWRVSDFDRYQNKHYSEFRRVFDDVLLRTDRTGARWNVIDGSRRKSAELSVYTIITDAIDRALAGNAPPVKTPEKKFPLIEMPLLCDVSLSGRIDPEDYKAQLEKAQARISELHNKLYRRHIPVIIGYEGWDAAGKGGNIKRLTHSLDARGFEVLPIASPEPHELARNYLWRFWNRLPKTGHITVFDRTWYGRVMVERIEGFCSEDDWKRAYTEINEFERELTDWGAIVVKFWLQIDKDTQLARFNERAATPEKQWKITDEDWRNREKWDKYEDAVNEMLLKTSTSNAPWYIIESVDKKLARVKALNIVIDAIEKAL